MLAFFWFLCWIIIIVIIIMKYDIIYIICTIYMRVYVSRFIYIYIYVFKCLCIYNSIYLKTIYKYIKTNSPSKLKLHACVSVVFCECVIVYKKWFPLHFMHVVKYRLFLFDSWCLVCFCVFFYFRFMQHSCASAFICLQPIHIHK